MRKLLACVAVLSFLLVLGAASHAGQPKIINVAHVFAIEHPVHQSLLDAEAWLKEASGGRFAFKIYPATTYATQKNSIRAVVMGTLDVFNVANSVDYYPPGGVLLAPYTFRDYDHWKKFKASDLHKDLMDKVSEAMGVKQMPLFTFGFRHATTKDKLCKTPADFSGVKLRVVNLPPYPEAAEVLGASGIPLPLADLYMALATGVVDGQENPYSQIFYFKFYEQQKYLIKTGHMLASDAWIVSRKLWNSLPKEDQDLLFQAFSRSADFIDAATIREEQELENKLVGFGMQLVEVDKAPFMERAKVILKKYPEWQELYDKIQAIK